MLEANAETYHLRDESAAPTLEIALNWETCPMYLAMDLGTSMFLLHHPYCVMPQEDSGVQGPRTFVGFVFAFLIKGIIHPCLQNA